MSDPLTDFIAACRVGPSIACGIPRPTGVAAIAPLMAELAATAAPQLDSERRRSDPAHYARNAIHIDPSGDLSLFALVWLPGQWTPVHDHGSWGVVGIVEGVLEEHALMNAHGDITADEGIVLRRGGVLLLNPGSVSSFVPNPDPRPPPHPRRKRPPIRRKAATCSDPKRPFWPRVEYSVVIVAVG